MVFDIVFDIKEIMQCLPHRYPFLLVDRIVELVPEDRVVGLKNVTINEPFFQGHFPGEPVMPGVLILEAMAQTGAIMLMQSPRLRGTISYLTSVDKAKFRRPVRPGDQLVMEAKLARFRSRIGRIEAVARVDDQIAAEAVMGFMLAEAVEGVRK